MKCGRSEWWQILAKPTPMVMAQPTAMAQPRATAHVLKAVTHLRLMAKPTQMVMAQPTAMAQPRATAHEPLLFVHPGWSPLGGVPVSATAAQLGGVA